MAETTIATGDAVAVKRWDPSFMRQMHKKIFWAPMSGKEPNNIVQVKTELTKNPGDRITQSLFPRLSGSGVQGDVDIEGFEEATTLQSDNITIDFYANAWRASGLMTEQRSPASLREEARHHLSVWAGERVDQLGFDAIESSPTAIWSENADTLTKDGPTASVTATDLIEPMMASLLRSVASTSSPKIKPINQGGREVYVLLMHDHCRFDMKNDGTWQNFHRDADVRDPKDNYLFKAGMGTIDDVLLYSHENVAITTNWGGGTVTGARNKLLGAQAMCLAWARYPFLVEKRFEYGTRWGAMVGFVCGFRKLTFNSKDFGLIEVRTARTNLS